MGSFSVREYFEAKALNSGGGQQIRGLVTRTTWLGNFSSVQAYLSYAGTLTILTKKVCSQIFLMNRGAR